MIIQVVNFLSGRFIQKKKKRGQHQVPWRRSFNRHPEVLRFKDTEWVLDGLVERDSHSGPLY